MMRLNLVTPSGKLVLRTKTSFPNVVLSNNQEKTITPTKVIQEVVPDYGFDGLSKVTVEAIPDEYIIPEGTKDIASNGVYNVKEFVNANVNVPDKILGTKSITQNGTYRATDDGLDGYSEVNVETSGVDINDYFNPTIKSGSYQNPSWMQNIKKWRSPLILEGTSCSYMFRDFPFDETVLPEIDVSNATSFYQMFYNAKHIKEIPWLKGGKADNMTGMFQSCNALQKVNLLNGEFATDVSDMFSYCQNLTDVGGIKDLGKAYLTTLPANYIYYKLGLNYSNKLTESSIINILNNLYDIKTKGCKTQQVILGSTNLAKLVSEEGQQALASSTEKGWSIS